MKIVIVIFILLMSSVTYGDYCSGHNNSITTPNIGTITFKNYKLCEIIVGAYQDCKFSNMIAKENGNVSYAYCEDELRDNLRDESQIIIVKPPKK